MRAISSRRGWEFSETPQVVWRRVAEVDRYRSWWPWLRCFDPGRGLVRGASWDCEVSPPLPYNVHFRIRIERVVEGRLVEATVSGDVEGTARLTFDELDSGGTSTKLVSHLAPANPLLRAVGTAARPMVLWGHDWVLDQGCRQFVSRGLR